MVRQGTYIYAWPSVYNVDLRVFFDKLTVKPKSSESAAFVMDTPYHNELKVPAHAIAWIKLVPAKAWSGAQCVHSALSVRMLESVEPFSTITVFGRFRRYKLKGLILAQNERWRRG